MRIALLAATLFLNACATTASGDIIRLPAESARDGDYVMLGLSIIAVPILLPFTLIGDLFVWIGGDAEDIGAIASATTSVYEAKAAQNQQNVALEQQRLQQQQQQVSYQSYGQPAPAVPSAPTNGKAPGRSAMDCVQVMDVAKGDSRLSGGGRIIYNACPGSVEVAWRLEGERAGNQWTLSRGGSWPVSVERNIQWAACHGANTVEGFDGVRFVCVAPQK